MTITTHSEALAFLGAHQPMPDDKVISNEESESFIAALRLLEQMPAPEAIPLLVGAVSNRTTLGMYEHIKFVLMKFRPSQVASSLAVALKDPDSARRFRASWWAADCPCPELVEPLQDLLAHESDEDVIFAAQAALEACRQNGSIE